MNPSDNHKVGLPFEAGITLDAGETVTRVIYRHPFDLFPTLFIAAFLELFALGLAYALTHFPEAIPFPSSVVLVMVAVTTLLAGIIFFIGIFVYRHNVLIFTNVHLIQVVQIGLFGRRVSQLSFLRVEDVTGVKKGFLQTLFDYGDIEIQTAGEQEKFIFHRAPHPERTADEALEVHEFCVREAAKNGTNE